MRSTVSCRARLRAARSGSTSRWPRRHRAGRTAANRPRRPAPRRRRRRRRNSRAPCAIARRSRDRAGNAGARRGRPTPTVAPRRASNSRGGAADATTGAGDEDDLSCEFAHRSPLQARRRGRRVGSARGAPARCSAACAALVTCATEALRAAAPSRRRMAFISLRDLALALGGATGLRQGGAPQHHGAGMQLAQQVPRVSLPAPRPGSRRSGSWPRASPTRYRRHRPRAALRKHPAAPFICASLAARRTAGWPALRARRAAGTLRAPAAQ